MVKKVTRENLSQFIKDPKTIRAFEMLFENLPQRYIDFDLNPLIESQKGRLFWNADEDCLNIGFDESVLQVGYEQYMRTENDTGSVIANGSVVGFAGVNGELKISKYIADGSIDSLYFIGVTTQELSDGEVGNATTFGKVRGIDTSAWVKGTILYSSATTPGALTSTRPTAPDYVIPVAAVLVQDATDGAIFVRPTIPPSYDYAEYSSDADQTLAAINTAYPVTFNTTDFEQGISVVSSSRVTVSQSGIYIISLSMQLTSSNSSAVTAYAWLAKNGVDVTGTRMDFTIKSNGDTKVLTRNFQISLQANDYIEIMWAGDSTNLTLDAIAATGFAPSAPSARVSITQIQY